MVATHPSRDHHGGLADVLDRFPVGMLLDGGDGTARPDFRASPRGRGDRAGVRRVRGAAPLAPAAGDLRIRVLSPPPRPPGPPPEDPNPRAVVAIVSCGGFDLLLSADAESEALLPLDLPDVDAMKVPTTAAPTPASRRCSTRLRPELAGIEVGEAQHLRPPGAVDPRRAPPRRRPDLPHRPRRHGDAHGRDGDACGVATER